MVVLYWSCERVDSSVNSARPSCRCGPGAGTACTENCALPLAVAHCRWLAALRSRKPPGTAKRALKSAKPGKTFSISSRMRA